MKDIILAIAVLYELPESWFTRRYKLNNLIKHCIRYSLFNYGISINYGLGIKMRISDAMSENHSTTLKSLKLMDNWICNYPDIRELYIEINNIVVSILKKNNNIFLN